MKGLTRAIALATVLICAVAAAQGSDYYAPANSVTQSGSGVLSLGVGPGTSFCNGAVVTYAGGSVSITGGATNYVYLNTGASCAPAVKTTAFVAADIPIAVVVSSVLSQGGQASSAVTDVRTLFVSPPSTGGGSALVLVEEHTASASAALNFTTCISSTYDDYVIKLVAVAPAAGTPALTLQVSTDGGSTYDAGAHYRWASSYTGQGSGPTRNDSSADTSVWLGNNAPAASVPVNGTVELFDPLSASNNKGMTVDMVYFETGNTVFRLAGEGWYMSNTAVNAFRVLASSGNLASGTVRCYGVAH